MLILQTWLADNGSVVNEAGRRAVIKDHAVTRTLDATLRKQPPRGRVGAELSKRVACRVEGSLSVDNLGSPQR